MIRIEKIISAKMRILRYLYFEIQLILITSAKMRSLETLLILNEENKQPAFQMQPV